LSDGRHHVPLRPKGSQGDHGGPPGKDDVLMMYLS
jgi:hypothetical protein